MSDGTNQARAGAEGGANPIRNEILAGRPLIALATHELEAAVIEAARVAGRLADMVFVVGETGLPRPFVEGFARTFGLTDGLPRSDGATGPGDPAFEVPALDADAVDWNRAIVVVRGGRHRIDGRADLLRRVEALAREGCVGGPGDIPLTVHPLLGEDRSRDGRAEIPFPRRRRTWLAVGCPTVLERAFRPCDWGAALSGYLRSAATHEGERMCAVVSGDRIAIAHATLARGDLRRDMIQRVVVYEVDSEGVLAGGFLPGAVADREALGSLALDAFLGGLDNVDVDTAGLAKTTSTTQMRIPPASMLLDALLSAPGEPAHDPSAAGVRAILEGRVDLPLHRAPCYTPWTQDVVRTVLRGGEHLGARREFCMTWPGMAGLILVPAVREAVDSGAETVPAVAAGAGVTRGVARRLVGRRRFPRLVGLNGLPIRRDPWNVDQSRSYDIGDFLGAFGHDRLPRPGDAEEWDAFVEVADVVFEIAQKAHAMPRRVPAAEVAALMLGGDGRTWRERRAALAAAAPDLNGMHDCGDMVLAFSRWIQALSGAADPSLGFRVMAGHGSLVRLHRASLRWHGTPSLGAPAGVDASWPVPFAPADLGGGIAAVALADAAALRDEGRRGPDATGMDGLGHCVGDYVGRCMAGKSLVVSLRLAEGGRTARLSTAEFAPDASGDVMIGPKPYRVVQHRAAGNGRPCERAERALAELVARLGDGRAAVDAAALEPRPGLPEETDMDAGTALRLHEGWRPMMPMAVRDLDPDGLRHHLRALDRGVPGPSAFAAVPVAGMDPDEMRAVRVRIRRVIHAG